MDKKQRKIVVEVNKIIRSRRELIYKFYPSIREIYNSHYDLPDMDPLRHEICICIMFGLCQSAITLTNHLLESLLKYSLIVKHGKSIKQSPEDIKGRAVSSLVEKYEEGLKLYNSESLNNNINSAYKEGLISKIQQEKLHTLRNKFRNAYGHADKNKTFGKSTMPVTGMKLEEGKIKQEENCKVDIAKLLIGQGLAQCIIAQKQAVPYFKYIDTIVREIKLKLFPEEK